VIIQSPIDPKQAHQIEVATAKMREESQKLSKLKDIAEIEEKRRAVEKDLNQAQDMAGDILRRADEDAQAMRHAAELECQELSNQARQAISRQKTEVAEFRRSFVAEQERFLVEKESLRLAQLSHAEAVRHLAREEELLHGKMEEAQRNEARYQASVEALRADLSSLTLRERKIHDTETRTIEGLKVVQERETRIAGKEDSAQRLKEEASRELSAAGSRSQEAQDKWNRALTREEACSNREKQLEVNEREYQGREQKLIQREHDIRRRENECLLRETQASVRPNVKA
jgi:hypothetical protein